jgi:hypothetical protein
MFFHNLLVRVLGKRVKSPRCRATVSDVFAFGPLRHWPWEGLKEFQVSVSVKANETETVLSQARRPARIATIDPFA